MEIWNTFLETFDPPTKFVALGSICSHVFTGDTLKFSAGRVFEWTNPKTGKIHEVFVSHHPSTVLGNKYIENSFMNDLKRMEEFLIDKNEFMADAMSCDITICDNSDQIKKFLSEYDVIAVDIETSGHSGSRKIDCISFSPDSKTSYVLDKPSQSDIESILEGKTCIFHHMVYDTTYIDCTPSFDVEDTLLITRCYEPMELSSLNELSKRYVPKFPSWKNFRSVP